ncbi:MAG: Thymidylate synthase complementing protein [candidate division WS6 bacterium GW2011_GWF1_35_23]|uniref:Thymidylate synthase complementing protein n=1 Tax=candidate division WS6 bacterium GW2011_GWF1_35_23 TaxID=1619097 RepID=A0A0G0C7G5_9BACT|nr:MAG: Thymidylate synthase complementing protein [candidate division WS6 bacterium GW2011_GWF1_35_23]
MKLSYRKDLNIATIKSESDWNKFKVQTLLQNPTQKQPSINAYLGARYSRSCDSITDIASEIMESGADAAEKLEMGMVTSQLEIWQSFSSVWKISQCIRR